jgi:hypothetical protein
MPRQRIGNGAGRAPIRRRKRSCNARKRRLRLRPPAALLPLLLSPEAVGKTTQSSGALKSRGTPPWRANYGASLSGSETPRQAPKQNSSPTARRERDPGGFTRQPRLEATLGGGGAGVPVAARPR